MGGGGGGKAPSVPSYTPPPVVEAANPETVQQAEAGFVAESNEKARKAAALAAGRRETILTGALGDVSTPGVQRKTLLGQ